MTDADKAYAEGRQWARWLPSVNDPPVSVNSREVEENWPEFRRGWIDEKQQIGESLEDR
jgi:hypothetical protein